MTAFAWYMNKYFREAIKHPRLRDLIEGKVPLDKYHVPHYAGCKMLRAQMFNEPEEPCTCGLMALAHDQLAKFLLLRFAWHLRQILGVVRASWQHLFWPHLSTWSERVQCARLPFGMYMRWRNMLWWPRSNDPQDKDHIDIPVDLSLYEQASCSEMRSQASGTDQVKA